jgi:archaellum component FlaC
MKYKKILIYTVIMSLFPLRILPMQENKLKTRIVKSLKSGYSKVSKKIFNYFYGLNSKVLDRAICDKKKILNKILISLGAAGLSAVVAAIIYKTYFSENCPNDKPINITTVEINNFFINIEEFEEKFEEEFGEFDKETREAIKQLIESLSKPEVSS